MAKKKELSLTFTGKAVFVADMKDFGPMEFSIDDIELTMEIVRSIMGVSGSFPVNSYNEKEGKRLKKLLNKKRKN